MLRTGPAHLESLQDGRVILLGSERVENVTTHPAFANGSRTVARLYELKRDPAHAADAVCVSEDGDEYSSYFLRPRSKEDLRKRMRVHRLIAEATHGMWGRSPDHVASFLAGMAMTPHVFADKGERYGENIEAMYLRMRREDAYLSYAINPPQGTRNPAAFPDPGRPSPALRVVAEADDGLVISGMKMLATGGVYSNYVLIGNITPLAPSQRAEAITCVVPANSPGLAFWARKPYGVGSDARLSPLSSLYDESDAMVLCKNVKVPWECVLSHGEPAQTRRVFFETPAHTFGNHQSNVRFHSKLKLISGLAHRVAEASDALQIPVVRETLGNLASMEALLGGVIEGQIAAAEDWGNGYLGFNRRMVYAALNWCTDNHTQIIDILRELCGGGMFQLPADLSVLDDAELAQDFATYFRTPRQEATERMRLMRLAWDLIGSEFGGRHQSYEKFYSGGAFAVRNYNYVVADWNDLVHRVDNLLSESEGNTHA
jgi:4-hydroxyphenylacetate 3-monooxygenase